MYRSRTSFRRQITSFLVLVFLIASAFYANAVQKNNTLIFPDDPSVTANAIITTSLRQVSQDNTSNFIAINQPGNIMGDSDLFADEKIAKEILEEESKQREEALPKIEAPFAVLATSMDGDGPRFAKNAQKRWPIASITKLMTAMLALENFSPDELVAVSKYAEDVEGVAGGIKAGEVYTVEDLIKAMVTVSSNDAAATFTEIFGPENFATMMQEKANSIGMADTTFMEATGLSYLNQSSAEDVYKLLRYVYSNYPQILEYSTKTKTFITEQTSERVIELGTINKFAGRPDFLGGKTGYTDEARGNLVSVFRGQNGMPIVVIVLGSSNRFEASLDALASYQGLLGQ